LCRSFWHLIGVWALLFNLSLSERRATLEQVQSPAQLSRWQPWPIFNALTQFSHGGGSDINASPRPQSWHALLQYPKRQYPGLKSMAC